jgi:N-acetylglucosaminyl-diphospho-decaprenol L-rhamnosyltransferase
VGRFPAGVVIASRDRRTSLLSTLARLEALPEHPPVVVVDNASGDGTAAAVRGAHPRVRVIELDENLGAAARTIGVRALDTPVAAFCDDDSWWAPGSLSRIAELFAARPAQGLVAGRILVGPDERMDPTCAEMAASPLAPRPGQRGRPILGFVACGAAVRSAAFLAAGGFHPRLGVGGEETLLAFDLAARGWELSYVDDVVIHHHPAPGRGRTGREATMLRNRLWAAWLRRPLPAAAAETARALAGTRRPRAAVQGLFGAARGLGWVCRDRRVLPRAVERDVRRLARA